VSRTLKRVPLDFAWPTGKTWSGYVNPYYDLATACPDCDAGYDRSGGRPDANAALFREQWYGNAPFDWYAYGAKSSPLTRDHPAFRLATRNVERATDFYVAVVDGAGYADEPLAWKKMVAVEVEAKRLHELFRAQWSHHLIQADLDALIADDRIGRLKSGRYPTVEEVNEWYCEGLGHDAINCDTCVSARCEREGVPFTCGRCGGSATLWASPEDETKCDAWERSDPPAGEGYQLWQTCSEGSPISPVFDSLDALCAWAEHNATTFGDSTATAEEWKAMLAADFVHAKDEEGNVYL
jgi:hypothetical protein